MSKRWRARRTLWRAAAMQILTWGVGGLGSSPVVNRSCTTRSSQDRVARMRSWLCSICKRQHEGSCERPSRDSRRSPGNDCRHSSSMDSARSAFCDESEVDPLSSGATEWTSFTICSEMRESSMWARNPFAFGRPLRRGQSVSLTLVCLCGLIWQTYGASSGMGKRMAPSGMLGGLPVSMESQRSSTKTVQNTLLADSSVRPRCAPSMRQILVAAPMYM